MRLAGVAFARDDHAGKCACLDLIEAPLAEDRLDAIEKCRDRQVGLAHLSPSQMLRLIRMSQSGD
ncbi:hypothetical protein D9M72_565450 [compost metagenome]